MERFLWIGLAGALGTWTRYLVGLWATKTFGPAFPWGTMIVNITGCFLIAIVMHVAMTTTHISETTRFALTTGFMGGLTTYSAFNYETSKLAHEGSWSSAAVNFGVTTVGCLLAGLLGLLVAKKIVGA